MLCLVAVHNNATFCLELPCSGIYIKHNDVHAKIEGRLLRRETCSQRVVEENHHQRLVLPEMLIFETLLFYLQCLLHCLLQTAEVLRVDKRFHRVLVVR